MIEERKEKDLDSRANRVQREEGRTVGSTRVTVTAAAFKQRGTLGGRRTKKTRTKTCYKKNTRVDGQSSEEIQKEGTSPIKRMVIVVLLPLIFATAKN